MNKRGTADVPRWDAGLSRAQYARTATAALGELREGSPGLRWRSCESGFAEGAAVTEQR